MYVSQETRVHFLRYGVRDRPATFSNPPAGRVRTGDLPRGCHFNTNNWIDGHIMAGPAVDAESFLSYIQMTTTHVAIVFLLQQKKNSSSSSASSDRSCGFINSALLGSLQQCSSLFNAKLELIENTCTADASDLLVDGSRFGQLIQNAVDEQFVLELFLDTFVIAQRFVVEEMVW